MPLLVLLDLEAEFGGESGGVGDGTPPWSPPWSGWRVACAGGPLLALDLHLVAQPRVLSNHLDVSIEVVVETGDVALR